MREVLKKLAPFEDGKIGREPQPFFERCKEGEGKNVCDRNSQDFGDIQTFSSYGQGRRFHSSAHR